MPKIKNPKVAEIKKAIKNGTYDWEKAIEHTAERIVEYPQSLLWK
jgi:anti-sigma28 factor (negative regulator of flagellin synthesis)